MVDLKTIDSSYTLFIDRDGVINYEKIASYIFNWEEFIFYEDVFDAFKIFNKKFGKIIMVTNQKGVGKQLMTEDTLNLIHQNMLQAIETKEGRIDKIFYCTDLDDNSINRKPNAGMAFKAKEIFKEIDFNKSLMIGNKLSDMKFGRNVGITTVFLATTNPEVPYPHEAIDYRFNNLLEFANTL